MSEYFTCRRILYVMIFLTFTLESSYFTNLTASIIVMIRTNTTNSIMTNFTKGPQYDWNVSEKNHLLGSINLGFVLTQAIGGRISELYGSKKIIFICIVLTSILTILHPVVFNYGFKAAYFIRFLLGFVVGPSTPSSTVLVVNWFSPSERVQSIALIAALNFGLGISMQIFALLIYYLNWPSMFYINGCLGLIWSIIWLYFIYDTPETHPRISHKEKHFIKMKMTKDITGLRKTCKKLPFTHIITCIPFWVIVLSRFCIGCSFGFMKYQIPTYYDEILHFDIRQNGFYSSLPFIAHGFCGFLVCYLANKLIKTNRFTKTTVRKIMECFHLLTVTISMLLLSLFGLNATIVVIVFIVCTLVMSTKLAGQFGNIIDLSPNFSGTLVGVGMTFYSIGLWTSTFICGILLKEKHNFKDWQNVFYYIGSFSFICAVIYATFASAKIQYWNDLKDEKVQVQEMESLNCNDN